MSEPPKWPDIGPCREGWYAYPEIPEEYKSCIHPYMVENSVSGTWYHKDAYEAAIARLRIAVEALGVVAAQDSGKPGSTARADCMAITAKQALNAIGPIPGEAE